MRQLPPSIMEKINKQNQTIYENANPKMSVILARARSSVRDNTYFTIEKIRQKAGITDIAVAVRRLSNYGPPDRLYNIWLDNGLVRTGHREYPDKLKAGWQNDFDIENGKAVSIVFDGIWELNKYKTWGKRTSELPWLFWVDNSNNLKARIWNTGTTYELATGVLKIDSLRGWVPAQAGHLDDQGVIVAYTKSDGKVYYRNYCLQPFDDLLIWEIEREIVEFGTGNLGVRLFRTNDFRVGFIAEKASGNMMAISSRNWSGMSIAPENLSAKIHSSIILNSINYIDKSISECVTGLINTDIYLCPLSKMGVGPITINRTSATQISIEFNDELYETHHSECFNVVSSLSIPIFTLINIEYSSKTIYLNLDNEMPTEADIFVGFVGGFDKILVSNTNQCKLELADFEIISYGEVPPSDGYIDEYLRANISSIITLNTIMKPSRYVEERLTSSITSTMQLWNIDDAPI